MESDIIKGAWVPDGEPAGTKRPKIGRDVIVPLVARDLGLPEGAVASTIELLEEGATVPFIARYRKERTGNLDETKILAIEKRRAYFLELEERKLTIRATVEGLGKWTPDYAAKVAACLDRQALEDLYLPYRPKKRTRATIARERGLGPLAELLLARTPPAEPREALLARFVDPGKGVATREEALAGACDIVAEGIAEDAALRGRLRAEVARGRLVASVKKDWKDKTSKFGMYYGHAEPLAKAPSHRLLAVRRGAEEEVLTWKVQVDEERAVAMAAATVARNPRTPFSPDLEAAAADAWQRLLYPSIANEVFRTALERAEREAIAVFATNLRALLLAPPAGGRAVLGLDPGFRTGCKLAVVDATGRFLEHRTIYPLEPQKKAAEAAAVVIDLVARHRVGLVAIGNGTASREALDFVTTALRAKRLPAVPVMVSEAGASVYSASEIAQAEFPDLDLTVRGAISIARRLQDPLAELVKIDPKSIGVGQYQHDVDQAALADALDATVSSAVNHVGVELNTASAALLARVAGIHAAVAKNIVAHRGANGPFRSRKELRKVPKLGPKTYEQCAGFLRIRDGANPLDRSAIHPERYGVVERIAREAGVEVAALVGDEARIAAIDFRKYADGDIGAFTLADIARELAKPGLDPRAGFENPEFAEGVTTLGDLAEGLELPGVVTNVTGFGAFVDIGVHQDGLVHVSQLADRFVSDPHTIVQAGDRVRVKVLKVDPALKRISLKLVRRSGDPRERP